MSKIKEKLNKIKIPDKIIVFPNKDKEFIEKWDKKRNALNIPHSFRSIIIGRPHSGKTLLVKNLILRQKPRFEDVYLIHCDIDYTKEYDDINPIKLEEIPSPNEWEGKEKSLVILEDLSFKDLNKFQAEALKRLYGYVSSHKNISVIATCQDFHDLPIMVRRCSNLFILFPNIDYSNLSQISKKVGLNDNILKKLFKIFCKSNHDSIWIDLTDDSPYPLRLNGYKLIKKI